MKENKPIFIFIQKGVTMLEMMLVLSIIGVILLLATRYYETTHSSSLITAALESIQAIYSAEQQYCNDYDCSTTPPSIDLLVKNGLLPTNFINYANPWGQITDHNAASSSPFKVTFSNVSSQNCINLQQKIIASYSSDGKTNDGEIQIPSCPNAKDKAKMEIDFVLLPNNS